ncbi:MAG: HNH endonuclease [Thermomicrobiales bacterium]|nr:HNH endonuclease [Thermomicrobiales bacterium]
MRLGLLDARINYAIVFDEIERDYDGTLSQHYWPNEGRKWDWIVRGSASVPTIPFSLEQLRLSRDYGGQDNPRYIDSVDEQMILPHVLWALASKPNPQLQRTPTRMIAEIFGKERALGAIFNHDRLELLDPRPPHQVITTRYERNPMLGESLKSYYSHRCQVCGHEFRDMFDLDYAEAHHIHRLGDGGPDVSSNIVVLCPNHHRIIHASNARFDADSLAFEYPNGLHESLILPDHLALSRDRGPAPRVLQQPLQLAAETKGQYQTE